MNGKINGFQGRKTATTGKKAFWATTPLLGREKQTPWRKDSLKDFVDMKPLPE